METRLYNTKKIEYKGVKYCPYCGKRLQKFTNVEEHYFIEEYWNCDCEDANKEHELNEQITRLQQQYPEFKYQVKTYTAFEPKD